MKYKLGKLHTEEGMLSVKVLGIQKKLAAQLVTLAYVLLSCIGSLGIHAMEPAT